MLKISKEQSLVEEMLNKIAPSEEIDFSGMLAILSKISPHIQFNNTSYKTKRIMYLQLLNHSIVQSIDKIILETQNIFYISKLSVFKAEVNAYSDELLKLKFDNDIEFEEHQSKMCSYFSNEWRNLNSINIETNAEYPSLMLQ